TVGRQRSTDALAAIPADLWVADSVQRFLLRGAAGVDQFRAQFQGGSGLSNTIDVTGINSWSAESHAGSRVDRAAGDLTTAEHHLALSRDSGGNLSGGPDHCGDLFHDLLC